MNASTQAALGVIMAQMRPGRLGVEQKRHLLISRSKIESSERLTVIVGRKPSGLPTPGFFA
jgi:hypothetical protein